MTNIETTTNSQPSWKNRRKVIFGSLIFCAVVISYVLISNKDNEIGQTAINGAYLLAGSVIGTYVAGAAWQDVRLNKKYTLPVDSDIEK